jgi:predicted nucleic acid-binding protein
MIVVDTDVLIWILRQHREVQPRFKDAIVETNGYLFITPIQIAEIYSGVRPKESIRVETFIDTLNILDLDKRTGRLAGEYLKTYSKSHAVTMADAYRVRGENQFIQALDPEQETLPDVRGK